MNTFVITIIMAVAMLAVGFAGIAIKIIVKKRGEFKRHCASVDPYTGNRSGCVCGRTVHQQCNNAPRYSPLEVNEELMRECDSN